LMTMEDTTLQLLIKQITTIYSSSKLEPFYLEHFTRKARNTKLDESAPEIVKKVERACNELGIRNVSRFYKVESDYYEWELQRRAKLEIDITAPDYFLKAFNITLIEHMSPIGMNQKLPIIVAKSITELKPPVFYLGAGHVDWKLALPIKNFIDVTGCLIADLV
ncbi:2843_t:CDS:2, partial [Gigaspora margarita]